MNYLKKYYSSLVSLFIFAVYLSTLAPSVVQIDSGELAAVQATLGIAHPTGYPLFTLAGFLFLQLPLPFTQIQQANLLAAIWCALGAFLFIKSVYLLFENLDFTFTKLQRIKNKKEKAQQNGAQRIDLSTEKILASICAGIFLAFSKTYWLQSTSVEVYSLQIFLFSLIIYAALRAFFSKTKKLYNWTLVALSFSLGFANHMTTLLVILLAAILFFLKEKFTFAALKKIFYSAAVSIPFLFLLYSYLPLRAAANPPINWGNPFNLENFVRHVSGRQYQVWLFSSLDSAKKQLEYFIINFPSEFAFIGLLIGLIGFFYSFKISKQIFLAMLITFLFSVLYSINYDIVDIDTYFLLSYFAFSFFIGFGSLRLLIYFQKYFIKKKIVSAVVLIVCLIPLWVNYSISDQSDVHTFEDYTLSILKHVEKDAIIFSYQWDYFISPSYYFQFVEKNRSDVAVIDKELLRRSWYFDQLKRNYPCVIKYLNEEIDSFLNALQPFERGQNYNATLLEKYYRTIMTKLISENINKRNYYIGLELFQNEMQRGEFSLPEGYQIVPHIFMFKVVKGNDYVPAPDPNFTIRFPQQRNKYIDFIETAAGTMLAYRAVYELQFSKPERAKVYIEKIRKDFPGYQIPFEILSALKM